MWENKPDFTYSTTGAAALQPEARNVAESERFLDALFSDADIGAGGFIEVRYLLRGSLPQQDFYDSIADAAACPVIPGHDTYFGVCPRNRKRGNKAAVSYVPCLWADIDAAGRDYENKSDALAAIRSFQFPPSMIIDSGGGYHVYWLFRETWAIEEPLDVQRIEAANKKIALALRGDAACHDIARVLRLPGTFNQKRGLPAAILDCDPARRYNLSDFDDLPDAPEAAPETSAERAARRLSEPVALDALSVVDASGDITRLSKRFDVAVNVMRLCGVHGPIESGKPFLCPLPGHEENNPSAMIKPGERGDIVFYDWHRRGPDLCYPLPDIYKACFVGAAVERLSKASRLTWWYRALFEAGIIKPAKRIARPLPDNAPDNARRAYDGFLLLLELRQTFNAAYWNTYHAPYSMRFCADWCRLSGRGQAQRGINWLLKHGFVMRGGSGSTKDFLSLCRRP